MVTKVTRDVLDLDIREIIDGIKITGNCGANFSMDGVPIGLGIPCDGTFVNLGATNVTTTNATISGTLDVTAASVLGVLGEIPVGGVIFFNAAFAGIPANFQLCDGTNGTPDMTDQFVYGTNTEGELLDSGGQADAVLPEHTHNIQSNGQHSHNLSGGGNDDDGGPRPPGGNSGGSMNTAIANAGNHSHTANTTGEDPVGKNLPPFIKLAFIQRMS